MHGRTDGQMPEETEENKVDRIAMQGDPGPGSGQKADPLREAPDISKVTTSRNTSRGSNDSTDAARRKLEREYRRLICD
jgi:hypothetical protein